MGEAPAPGQAGSSGAGGRPPPGAAPPAWYKDPWGVAPLRWWDGRGWTAFTYAGGPKSAEAVRPIARPATPIERSGRPRMRAEVLIVLAIFPFPYVVNALAALVQAAVHEGSSGRFPLPITGHLSLSFLLDVLLALEPVAAAALAVYLLTISGEKGAEAVGLDRSDPRQDLALLLPVFLFCFLIPEVGVSLVLRGLHVHTIAPASQTLPAYFSIVGALNAVTAGVVEEIVVLGFLVRRLEQLGHSSGVVVCLAVLVRISYHVYYGWGVIPIAAWALASVLMYRRYRRLGPFIVVHVLWDLGILLVPFFGSGPLGVEVLVLGPSTFAFWLMWHNRLAVLSGVRRSGPWSRAR